MKHTAADLDILARTVWAEARGESWLGRLAVAHVIVNRAKARRWWGYSHNDGVKAHSLQAVCRKPWQFSCWNPGDPNRPKMERLMLAKSRVFQQCLAAAAVAVHDPESSPVGLACHYHVKGLDPPWSRGKTPQFEIGKHVYFEGIR